MDDDLDVFVQLGTAVHLEFEHQRAAPDAAQRVLDLVGQVADQLLVGLDLVDVALVAVLPRLLLAGISSTIACGPARPSGPR